MCFFLPSHALWRALLRFLAPSCFSSGTSMPLLRLRAEQRARSRPIWASVVGGAAAPASPQWGHVAQGGRFGPLQLLGLPGRPRRHGWVRLEIPAQAQPLGPRDDSDPQAGAQTSSAWRKLRRRCFVIFGVSKPLLGSGRVSKRSGMKNGPLEGVGVSGDPVLKK